MTTTDDSTTDAPADTDRTVPAVQVFRVYIEAPAERVWAAITSPEFSNRYGYGGDVEYDLSPGGDYRNLTTAQMKEMGMGDVAVTGRVLEVDPPRRLVQTWVAAWHGEETTLTWDLEEYPGPLTGLTLTHDCTGAPASARDVSGAGDPAQGGGGWPWVLAGIKTLLETGRPMVGSGA
ncbi:SRPBCC domain-containing protein [Phycicoccus sp. BSK3Z-2]|uniref:SRPBCC domain-containing protein n=1 Tax=Phycicoccus avicenniae TaxID=2828860 RepID=A0A941I0K5_9MICO|nr:SRPBCC domain-containing protein [Phycicoccus avicenniae]MBR7743209.1 SRPBCC domain-containing protein [Phycicoccus avicenniae]